MGDEGKTREQLIAELVELRREMAGSVREGGIGEMLVEMGYITSSQLQRAVQKQKESDVLKHRRLAEALVGLGFITREEKNKALAEQRRRLSHSAQHVEDRVEDEGKTKGQLIVELVELRRRVAEMGKEIDEFEESEIDYMRGVRIGEILIGMGYLTFSQLHRTLRKQKESDILRHKRLGEIMVEQGLITVEERDSALEEQRKRLRA
jgi:hypothetical protein